MTNFLLQVSLLLATVYRFLVVATAAITEPSKAPVCTNRYTSTPMDLWKSRLTTTYPLSFSGDMTVVRANDAPYEDLRRHRNNFQLKSDATYIVLPRIADEVVEILRVAVANNVRPTVRSGAHCYADFWSNNTGGLLIDLSAMNRVYRLPNENDDAAATIWVESGATVEEMNEIAYKKFGIWPPAGVCTDLGVGGHVLGGGYGYYARKFGILADYAYAFEIARVRADKSIELVLVDRNSTEQNERDLYWALRGAGQQNFGVVTKIGFRNFPRPPPVVYYQYAFYNIGKGDLSENQFVDLLTKYTRFFAEHSAPGDEYCDMFTSLTIGRNPTKGKSLELQVFLIGEKRELVDRFFQYVGLDGKKFSCDKMTTHRLSLAEGYRNDYSKDWSYVSHSAYMRSTMPLHQIQTIWQHFTSDSDWSSKIDSWVQIRSYGCGVSLVSEDATAYPHRRAVIKMQFGTTWAHNEDSSEFVRFSRSLYGSLYGKNGPVPDDVMDGCYVSYPDADLIDAQHLYYKSNYERLKRVKQQWDPLNIFRHRHSIELPSPTA